MTDIEAFERWASLNCQCPDNIKKNSLGVYEDQFARNMSQAWQAACKYKDETQESIELADELVARWNS